MENDYNDKVSRVLNLYQRFMDGEVINKNIEAERLGVSSRTIQRDIGAIRNFLDEEVGKSGVVNSIIYDEKLDGHRLEQIYKMKLSNSEILAICKILLDQRQASSLWKSLSAMKNFITLNLRTKANLWIKCGI